MKKGWLIGTLIGVIALLIIVGNMSFQQRVDQSQPELANAESATVQVEVEPSSEDDVVEMVDEGQESRVSNLDEATEEFDHHETREQPSSSTTTATENQLDVPKQADPKTLEDKKSTEQAASVGQRHESQQKSLSAIRRDYVENFQQLEFQVNWKVDSLIDEAEHDVFFNGFNNIDKDYYVTKGRTIEAEADAAFQKKYAQMQNELKKNGHSQNALEEFRTTYEQRKQTRRQSIEARAGF